MCVCDSVTVRSDASCEKVEGVRASLDSTQRGNSGGKGPSTPPLPPSLTALSHAPRPRLDAGGRPVASPPFSLLSRVVALRGDGTPKSYYVRPYEQGCTPSYLCVLCRNLTPRESHLW